MTLEEAQQAKYRRICEKLGLGPDSHVLEIGCGWGGFALHAAARVGRPGDRPDALRGAGGAGARARRRRRASPTASTSACRTTARCEGSFTHIASIEMLEAIGHRELPVFFGACDRLLAPDGVACIQTIAVPDQRYERYRRGNDWIREYIFPGAAHPLARGDQPRDDALVGADRARRSRTSASTTPRPSGAGASASSPTATAVLALGYDERFIRTWEFYLAFCEAGFRTRALHDYQLVLTRPFNDRLPAEPALMAPAGPSRQDGLDHRCVVGHRRRGGRRSSRGAAPAWP